MPIYQLDDKRPEFPSDGRYWVAETAVLIGRVRLKLDTSVWWGAVLRGDNSNTRRLLAPLHSVVLLAARLPVRAPT